MPKRFLKMKKSGEKIAALTAYDATFAAAVCAAGADFMLVGDSLGMVVQGRRDTLGVRLSDTAYHTRAVVAGAPPAFVIADMPFATFQESPARAFANAARLLAAGASMVKLEGGQEMAETVNFLTARGVPVCAHVGLMPQFVRASGGYALCGRAAAEAERVKADALAMQDAGAALVVLEMLPRALAAEITAALALPTIGIGCGAECDGQILVLYDLLGLTGGGKRFVRDFLRDAGSIQDAIAAYVAAVKAGDFPAAENTFQ